MPDNKTDAHEFKFQLLFLLFLMILSLDLQLKLTKLQMTAVIISLNHVSFVKWLRLNRFYCAIMLLLCSFLALFSFELQFYA